MKSIRLAAVILAAATLPVSSMLADELDDAAKQMAAANNAFAIDLHKHLAKDGRRNIVFSPYSVNVILTATATGARGDTVNQMRKTLRLPDDMQAWKDGAKQLRASIVKMPSAHVFTDANGLFLQRDYQIHKPWTAAVREGFQADIFAVDFGETDKCVAQINQWASQNTKGLIRNAIDRGAINDDIRFVIANAVYFHGFWTHPFDPKHSRHLPFHVASNRTEKAVFMLDTFEDMDYAETDQAQILKLPYRQGETSMIVVLPKRTDGLAEIEKGLDAGFFSQWTDRSKSARSWSA